MSELPQARTAGIVVQDLGQELLIYDLRSHRAYTLNETAKIVFEACDGNTSFDELKRKFKFTDDLIHFALSKLAASDLLRDYQTDHFQGLSRREVIRRVGLASLIALPVISTIVAPSAARAASGCLSAGARCELNDAAACCSKSCLVNDGSPICNATCLVDNSPCELNNATACCSLSCAVNNGNPICAPACLPNGSRCELNNAAACCSTNCAINNGSPVCAAR